MITLSYVDPGESSAVYRQIAPASTAQRVSPLGQIQQILTRVKDLPEDRRLPWLLRELNDLADTVDRSVSTMSDPQAFVFASAFRGTSVAIGHMTDQLDSATLAQLARLVPAWYTAALEQVFPFKTPVIETRPADPTEGESAPLTSVQWRYENRTLTIELQGGSSSYVATWYEPGPTGGLRIQEGAFSFEPKGVGLTVAWLKTGMAPA